MTATPSRHPATRIWLIALALFVGTLLIFSRSLSCEFLNYDDQDYITHNTHVQAGLTTDSVRWAFTATAASNWHPLTWISHELDWTLYGNNPVGHHATNVLIHSFSAVLVFLTLRRLTSAFWTAAFCAALWAWHPLRVESVTWIAERKDVLGAFFWFLTLLAWTGYIQDQRNHATCAWRWYAFALASFILGLLSKPMLVTLPCVFFLLDFWPLKRSPWPKFVAPTPIAPFETKNRTTKAQATNAAPTDSARRSGSFTVLLFEKAPFILLSIASCIITYIAQKSGGAVSADLTFGPRLANAFISIPRYLEKFLWPSDLAVLYPHPGYWSAGLVLLAVFFTIGATVFTFIQWHRRPWLAIGWFWFTGTLVPVSGIVQVGLQSIADRYTYIPIIGIQIATLWTLRDIATAASIRRAFAVGAGAILFTCAIATWTTQAAWKNSFTLFTRAVQVTQENYLAWNNLGTWYSEQKLFAESIPCYRESIAIRADYAIAHNNLGHALAETGAIPEALEHYRVALLINPKHLTTHCNYANALTDAGKPDEALKHYQIVLDQDKTNTDALNGRGMALALQGNFIEAEKTLRTAIALQQSTGKIDARTNLATLYAMNRRFAEAACEYRIILQNSPNEAQVHNNLANVLFSQNASAEAVEHYHRAIELRPRNPEAHSNLGLALIQLSRFEEARQELHIALEQQPNLPQIRAVLKELDEAHPARPPTP